MVEIDLQGVELAKWAANRYGHVFYGPSLPPVGENVHISALYMPIYVDVDEEVGSDKDAPYLGSANATFIFRRTLFEGCQSNADAAVRAMNATREAGVPIDQCEYLHVRVGHYQEQ